MIGQRPGDPTNLFVVVQGEGGLFTPRGRDLTLPHAHQGVLQQRELIGIGTEVVEKAVDEVTGDLAPEHLGGADDGHLAVLARQARGQVLTVVDGLG